MPVRCASFGRASISGRALRRRRLFGYAASFSALAATTISPDTDAAQVGRLAVSAYVPPGVASRVEQQAAVLTVTPEDIARGYVEVPAGSRLRVRSNDPAGFIIDFFPRLPIFKAVRVSTRDGSAQLGADGGAMAERRHRGAEAPLELSYRFELADHVQPGTYPWPLATSVRPR